MKKLCIMQMLMILSFQLKKNIQKVKVNIKFNHIIINIVNIVILWLFTYLKEIYLRKFYNIFSSPIFYPYLVKNKNHTNKNKLESICTQKKRGRPSKLKTEISSILTNKKNVEVICQNEQNNYKTNKSNKSYMKNKICVEKIGKNLYKIIFE
jgi:hypothetical protein